ncbi:MAG: hypothetical protein Q9190_002731 [Brigantiaea leucoxantha]
MTFKFRASEVWTIHTVKSVKTCCILQIPVELQVQILKYALTAKAPFVNAGIPRDSQNHVEEDEIYGTKRAQCEGVISILKTCRHFHNLGEPLFYKMNDFLYTADSVCSLEISKDINISRYPRKAQNLTLRSVSQVAQLPPRIWPRMIRETVRWVLQFPHLRNLQVDFVLPRSSLSRMYVLPSVQKSKIMNRTVVKNLTTLLLSNIRIDTLVLTGLPIDVYSAVTVGNLSKLVHRGGLISLGMGSEGKMYKKRSYHCFRPCDVSKFSGCPQLQTLKVEEVDGWVLGKGDNGLDVTVTL